MNQTNKDAGLVKAFMAARKYIEAGTERYICYALAEAHGKNEISYALANEAQKLILGRLGHCVYLETWIARNVPDAEAWITQRKREGGYTWDVRTKMRITRLAWLDSLIKEFS